MPVWETGESYKVGYIAGFFDGEGCLSQRKKQRLRGNGNEESIFAINATQVPNAALDTTVQYLHDLGFKIGLYPKRRSVANWKDCVEIKILGGTTDALKFLGYVRPKRLLTKLDLHKLGAIKNPCNDDTELVDITPVGEQTVYALGTSTGTYISEGYLSHNTPAHTGREEDWEDVIDSLIEGSAIGSHSWFDINGKIFDVKHKVGSSQIPHGRLTPLAREILWNRQWAGRGEQPRADVLLRAHNHYFEQLDHDDCLGFNMPCLQGFGSKYGSRECSGTIDMGILVFDVYDNGEIKWHKRTIRGKSQVAKVEKL